MIPSTLTTVILLVLGSVLLTVGVALSALLVYAYRRLEPVDKLWKRVLALEGGQDEIERQLEVIRKSAAGQASARKRAAAGLQGVQEGASPASLADELRRRAASGGV
jgi:hypothetical protein